MMGRIIWVRQPGSTWRDDALDDRLPALGVELPAVEHGEDGRRRDDEDHRSREPAEIAEREEEGALPRLKWAAAMVFIRAARSAMAFASSEVRRSPSGVAPIRMAQ